MAFILDTSVAIELRDNHPMVRAKFIALDQQVSLSMVSVIELEGGVYRDLALTAVRRARLDALLARLPLLEFDLQAPQAYGRIVAAAGYSRRKLLDRMIAAQALVHQATIITANAPDFRDVPGLSILDWG